MGEIRINKKVRHVTEDGQMDPSLSKFFFVFSYVFAVIEGI